MKIELPHDAAIPLLGIYLKEKGNADSNAALLTTAETGERPKHPLTDEWIKKMWYIFTVEYYFATKRRSLI